MSLDLAWSGRKAPTLDELTALAQAAFTRLPPEFRALCEGIHIRVAEFPDDEVIEAMGLDDPFELLGLFRGVGLAHAGAVALSGQMPNMIWLYRRPILDEWADGDDTLDAIVTHVLVHEIGHHVGLSDADMDAIERQATA